MENTMVVELPEDMQRVILSWLPLKSLLKFMCVSKKWASIMRTKYFQDLHYVRSETRPRVLLASCQLPYPNQEIAFHSFDQDKKLFLTSRQQHMRFPYRIQHDKIYAPIRGLFCLQSGTKVVICNPGIRKVRTLPEIKGAEYLTPFLGYDEVKQVYKVLCIAFIPSGKSDASGEHKAFTMGLGEESWKSVVCNRDHSPVTNGVWKGEVLYYGARSGSSHDPIVMSFNLRSEKFNDIDPPEGVRFGIYDIFVNYKENVAFVKDFVTESNYINMFVRDEIFKKWLVVRIEIPSWNGIFGDEKFCFQGFIGTDHEELVFGQKRYMRKHDGPLSVIYYNEATKKHKKFPLDGTGGSDTVAWSFFNHVDSLSLL